MRRILLTAAVLAGSACATSQSEPPTTAPPPETAAPTAELERPIPYPVQPPGEYRRAVSQGTRSSEGDPGPSYWQQWADYVIEARVDAETKSLTGSETIRYHNNAPTPLPILVLNVIQNYHAEGAMRIRPAEVTGGITVERVAVDGQELGVTTGRQTPGWVADGTLMYIVLPEPVPAAGTVELAIDWSFALPQAGASGRMGYSGDELLYLAYWYPQLAVYDDVIGWHTDPFLGNAEFYSDFGRYDVTIDAPAGWLVMSTGTLENPDEVLAPAVARRLRESESSDDVVHVVTHDGTASATAESADGRLLWEFAADSVRDVAFAVMRNHAWDAARTPVGDRDGDGSTDYSRVDAFWRASAENYVEAWRYAQHSIDFLSRFTGLSYPWPHMSVVEGGGIIGGGMEFPMMTLIGDYNQRGGDALYGVTAHELAHMWVPMMLSTNERRYAWLDEGTTSFNENNARAEFFEGSDPYAGDQQGYLSVARMGAEGPILRWSDTHRPGPAYGVASYAKPATVLHALRGVLGPETFERAWRAYYDRWAFKHPYPWDMFNTFEDVAGRDLDWFWRSWYYESTQDGDWFLDQAVGGVERLTSGETRITVRDLGWVPMPVRLRITRADGEVLERTIPVDRWLAGASEASVTIPDGPEVTEVVIDPDRLFPDIDRRNNDWTG
jgi:hypothetical protein